MKSSFSLTGIAIIFFSFVAGFSAQTTTQLRIDFEDQPGSPLKLSLTKSSFYAPAMPLELLNVDSRPIRAFVLIADSDGSRGCLVDIRLEKLIVPGKPIVYINSARQNTARAVVSVDYVQFADGTSWGADLALGSRMITPFIEGRELAITRLQAMLAAANLEPDDFMAPIRAHGGFGIGGPAAPKNEPKGFGLEGYRSVISALRENTKRTPEAQEFAKKLELGEKSIPK